MALIIAQIGIAKVEGANAVLDALIGITNQSIKVKHNWKSVELMDSNGFWIGEDARNMHAIITVTYKLTAASKALAAANGAFLLPFAQINLSAPAGTVDFLPILGNAGVGGLYTGGWCYHQGLSIDLSNENPGGGEIELRKFADPTQNAQQFVIPA